MDDTKPIINRLERLEILLEVITMELCITRMQRDGKDKDLYKVVQDLNAKMEELEARRKE